MAGLFWNESKMGNPARKGLTVTGLPARKRKPHRKKATRHTTEIWLNENTVRLGRMFFHLERKKDASRATDKTEVAYEMLGMHPRGLHFISKIASMDLFL